MHKFIFYIFRKMFQIHKNVEKASTVDGTTWNDVCMKLPIVNVDIDGSVEKVSKRQMSKRSVDKTIFDQISLQHRMSKRNVDASKDEDDSWSNIFDDFSSNGDEDGFESQVK